MINLLILHDVLVIINNEQILKAFHFEAWKHLYNNVLGRKHFVYAFCILLKLHSCLEYSNKLIQ